MTYASERGFKVGKEYIATRGIWRGWSVLFVKDDETAVPVFQCVSNGEKVFIHIDNFDVIKHNDDYDRQSIPKQILLKYIDEKYYDDDFLKYLISLV